MKRLRIGATALLIGLWMAITPAQATPLVDGDTIQFSYYWDLYSFEATNQTVTIAVTNNITNKIGWDGEVIDSYRITVGEQIIEVTEKHDLITYTFEIVGTQTILLEGIDNGYWGGYYGPIMTITLGEALVIEPTPEPTPELTPELTPEPTPEPILTIEPTPEPTPIETQIVVPPPSPSTPEPAPIPEPTPTPKLKPKPIIEPTLEPTIAPFPEQVPIIEPDPIPEPVETINPEQVVVLEVPEILASIPGAETLVATAEAIMNVGSDMTPEQREEAQQVVVASVLVTQIASIRRK